MFLLIDSSFSSISCTVFPTKLQLPLVSEGCSCIYFVQECGGVGAAAAVVQWFCCSTCRPGAYLHTHFVPGQGLSYLAVCSNMCVPSCLWDPTLGERFCCYSGNNFVVEKVKTFCSAPMNHSILNRSFLLLVGSRGLFWLYLQVPGMTPRGAAKLNQHWLTRNRVWCGTAVWNWALSHI